MENEADLLKLVNADKNLQVQKLPVSRSVETER